MARRFSDKVRAQALAAVRKGQTYEQAGRTDGVTRYSVFNWVAEEKRKERSVGFSKLKIRAVKARRPPADVAATARPSKRSSVPAAAIVSATLPDGTRIDGVTVEFLIAWLGRAQRGSLP